ncbi:MAG TPA: ankyrin repeat domain-containing protein [Gemmatimonadaceae bacterium]|jgi:ankyrin repeat protein|nr:ankyrin repeat domain-containing protein [Gemmatimonadaceae bacterium]
MSDETPTQGPAPRALPGAPNLEWLRKEAKRRLTRLRETRSDAQLSDAQFEIAKEYGFPSWRGLKAHVDSLSLDGQLFDAAKKGDVARLRALLDEHPDRRFIRDTPYEWTLLHAAASRDQNSTAPKDALGAVNLLLDRGLDPNARERGDNTYAMHWAAAAGDLPVVRRLADAGGDVVGHGDDHELEVIGWATCWEGGDDAAHRAVADFLVSRGANHHIFSAIAMNLGDEVRRIVAANPGALNQRLSRNENHQSPLHFAIRMNKPAMVDLLIELGADPLAVDGSGNPPTAYAHHEGIDRPIVEKIRAMTVAELDSAERGHRQANVSMVDLVAALSLADFAMAERLVKANPGLVAAQGASSGALHMLSMRNDARGVRWLLDHGADVNGLWTQWDSRVTALHLAAGGGHVETVRALLAAGASTTILDSRFEGDALGWARHFDMKEVIRLLEPLPHVT